MTDPDDTTQQLRYDSGEPTTQSHLTAPAPAPPEPASGRMPVAPSTPPASAPPPSGPGPGDGAGAPDAGRGQTTIADDVVERVIQKVVDLTVAEVDGVHGLRPGVDSFFAAADEGEGTGDRAAERAGERAVAVRLADGRARIDLAVEVYFGYAVHEVVDQVRTSVISSAERLLGMTVAEVNVVVADVSFDTGAAPAGGGAAEGEKPGAGGDPGGRRTSA